MVLLDHAQLFLAWLARAEDLKLLLEGLAFASAHGVQFAFANFDAVPDRRMCSFVWFNTR